MVQEKLMERDDWQQRTELLLGEEKMNRIRNSHVLVVGLGGVGAYAAEMICRAGVGRMTIVDADTVQPTNLNRQLPALHSTLGMSKAEVLATRYKDINPDIDLTVLPVYLKDENIPELLDAGKYDFIVDAIDTISPKCFLIYEAMKRRIRIVSSMGAGAKSDITQVRFADLWDTYHCGLSKAQLASGSSQCRSGISPVCADPSGTELKFTGPVSGHDVYGRYPGKTVF